VQSSFRGGYGFRGGRCAQALESLAAREHRSSQQSAALNIRTKLIERGATALDNITSSGSTSGEDLGKIIRAMKRLLEARADEEDDGEPPPTLRKLSQRELQQQRDAAQREHLYTYR
jgi:hypothetical protein